MTSDEYYKRHGADLSNFLNSQAGKDLITHLQFVRPNLVPHPAEHLIVEAAGAARGYEQCIKNIFNALIPKTVLKPIDQTYSVKEPQEPPPFIPEFVKEAARRKALEETTTQPKN